METSFDSLNPLVFQSASFVAELILPKSHSLSNDNGISGEIRRISQRDRVLGGAKDVLLLGSRFELSQSELCVATGNFRISRLEIVRQKTSTLSDTSGRAPSCDKQQEDALQSDVAFKNHTHIQFMKDFSKLSV